jgi:hypothetical protein
VRTARGFVSPSRTSKPTALLTNYDRYDLSAWNGSWFRKKRRICIYVYNIHLMCVYFYTDGFGRRRRVRSRHGTLTGDGGGGGGEDLFGDRCVMSKYTHTRRVCACERARGKGR